MKLTLALLGILIIGLDIGIIFTWTRRGMRLIGLIP